MVQFIKKKEFIKVILDKNIEGFIVHVASISLSSKMIIYPAREAQVASLSIEKVTVLAKYLDFADLFSKKSVTVLPEWIDNNEHAINLEKSKQPTYWPIYSLGLVELETLKTYIETNLANDFIQLFKSPNRTPILFVQKPDGSPCLCINHRDLNNLIIKNCYPLLLIKESLDWLG